MPGLSKRLASLLAASSVVLLFASLVTLFIVFLVNTKAGAQFGTMWKGIAAFIPGAAVGGVVFRGLVQRLRQQPGRSVSSIVTAWLSGEWLLQACVWVFVFVELVALSYLAPIYSLQVSVSGGSAPLGDGVRVVSVRGNLPFTPSSPSGRTITFQSSRSFRWGDSTRIRVTGAESYGDDSLLVQWPALAFTHVLGSVTVPEIRLRPLVAQLTVEALQQVKIMVDVEGERIRFQGPKVLRVRTNSSVRLVASAPGYSSFDTSFIVRSDAAVVVTLSKAPGTIRIRAFNPGGQEQLDVEVIIADSDRRYAIGTSIERPPGRYRVRIEKRRTDGILYAGPFELVVQPGELTECRFETAVRELDSPPPPQGGRLLRC